MALAAMRKFPLRYSIVFQALFGAGFFLFSSANSQASSLVVPTDTLEAPAVDLIYQGKKIDRDSAVDLAGKGVDLSTLEPATTDAWQPDALPLDDGKGAGFPPEGSALDFDSLNWGTRGIFRLSAVFGQGDQAKVFRVHMSLNSHVAMMNSALLRAMGYVSPTPRYYRNLTLRFKDLDSRQKVLDEMVLQTGRAADDSRWVKSFPKDTPEMVVQDVVLEEAQLDNRTFHWSTISGKNIKGRRAIRALIIPFVWLDIPESINRFSWEAGKTNEKSVWLTHDYAGEFRDTAYEDCRWILRKIARMGREDLQKIVLAGKYPDDVAALILEKLIARRNHLIRMFNLKDELPSELSQLDYNPTLSVGAVKEGNLTQERYDGYAERFSHPLPDSPLRIDEIGRFSLLEGISFGMEQLLNRAQQHLGVSQTDVANAHNQKLQQEIIRHIITQPGVPFTQPIATWGGAIGGVQLSASRTVVTGTYYGSDSKVQLVDNIAAGAQVGYFLGLDGIPKLTLGVGGNVMAQFNYTHVHPIAEIKEGITYDWGNLWVPGFMGGLRKLLETQNGSATGLPNICFVADDPAVSDTKCPAQPPADGRVPATSDPEKDKAAVDTFLDGLKENELFIVTESRGIGLGLTVQIPLTAFLPTGPIGLGPSVGFGVNSQYMILSRTTFVRTKDGIQIYLQSMSSLGLEISLNVDWFINIARISHGHKDGSAQTRAFLLDNAASLPDTDEKRRKWLLAMRAMLTSGNTEVLAANFHPWELDHSTSAEITKGKFLFWKWYSLQESHRVTIRPPVDPDHPFDPKDKERTLYSYRDVSLNGNDYFGFVGDIVGGLEPEFKFNTDKYGNNPANAPFGSSHWTEVRTEAETTEKAEFQPVSIVEEHWMGWVLPKGGAFQVLDAIDQKVRPINHNNPIIRRDEFNSMGSLQMYEFQTTQIIYPKGLKKIEDLLFPKEGVTQAFVNIMNALGHTTQYALAQRGPRKIIYDPSRINPRLGLNDNRELDKAYTEVEGDHYMIFMHLPADAQAFLQLRSDHPTESEKRVEWTNDLVKKIRDKVTFEEFVNLVGLDNFLFQAKVSGFRTGDENGDVQYVSDSIGKQDTNLGMGIFAQFADKYKIMSNELRAIYLSEGF